VAAAVAASTAVSLEERVRNPFTTTKTLQSLQSEACLAAYVQKRVTRKIARHASFKRALDGDPTLTNRRRPIVRALRAYQPHGYRNVKLTMWQEWMIFMIFIRRGLDKVSVLTHFLYMHKHTSTHTTHRIFWQTSLSVIPTTWLSNR
jgi:hypothetical protein